MLGAAIGFFGDLGYQLANNGGNLSCVSWGQVGAAALVGAAVGAIGPAALGGADEAAATRVFWSGGNAAKNAAAEWAAANGGETLEMTQLGQSLEQTTAGLPWSEAGPMWQTASQSFAEGASGEVHVFLGENVNPAGIWSSIEQPALSSNPDVTNIIVHSIK